MRKFLTLAVAAALIAGAALAQTPMNTSSWAIRPNATFPGTGSGVFAGAGGSGPTTTNNDDSCDISVAPAATLLLPNFEVSVTQDRTVARDTLFSITNTSNIPQIAHVTIWTDRSFPVIDFNLFLTGYDVVPVSLYDLIVRGQIPPTSITPVTTHGSRSVDNNLNPNFLTGAGGALATCAGLPGPIPSINADGTPVAGTLLADIQNALTVGTYGGLTGVGNNHPGLAVGYVTADVAATCSTTLPTTSTYYTTEILFDNVLIGEYVRVNPSAATGNYAGGNPMVHIRAIPEGGPVGLPLGGAINFPFTFYDRYTPAATRNADRRQPLPGTFAARYIVGTPLNFGTDFAIWREGTVMGAGVLAAGGAAPNAAIPMIETVRFDESENPTTIIGGVCQISPCPVAPTLSLPETSTPSVNDAVFPADFGPTADAGGWVYMNLNNNSPNYGGRRATGPVPGTHAGRSQNWVTVQMTSESRYGVDFDAAWLGNGCSVNPGVTGAGNPINPSGGFCTAANPNCNVTP